MKKFMWYLLLFLLFQYVSFMIWIKVSDKCRESAAYALSVDKDAIDNFADGYYIERTDDDGELIRNKADHWPFFMFFIPFVWISVLTVWRAFGDFSDKDIEEEHSLDKRMNNFFIWIKMSKKKKIETMRDYIRDFIKYDFERRLDNTDAYCRTLREEIGKNSQMISINLDSINKLNGNNENAFESIERLNDIFYKFIGCVNKGHKNIEFYGKNIVVDLEEVDWKELRESLDNLKSFVDAYDPRDKKHPGAV